MTINASVYMIVLNEADCIARALNSVRDFKEVVILDSGSSDSTLEIIQGFSNARVQHQDWLGFSGQKSAAMSECSSDWVLNLDADEELTEDYIRAVKDIIADNNKDALLGVRTLLRFGKRSKNFQKTERLVRFFRRSKGRYNNRRVHEGIEIDGETASTEAEILHHENLSFSERLEKDKRYSSLKALDKFDQGKRANIAHLVLVFPLSLLQCYFVKGFFRDGIPGALISINMACYNFMKYAKLWELQRNSGQEKPESTR